MKRTLQTRYSNPTEPEAAFTLLDLLAVLAICALLAAILAPAWASSQSRSQSARCEDNLRRVMGAVMMYTHDNHDFFPPNPDDSGTKVGYHWCPGNAMGGYYSEPTGMQAFDPDILGDTSRTLIASYLQRDVTVFRCTADWRTGIYTGTNSAFTNTIVPAARTISMSSAVGTIVANQPVSGVWLDGTHTGNQHNRPWRTYGKTSDIVAPTPANLIVVLEEDPFSINDCVLGTTVATPRWVDWPSTLHNMGGVISFADGHVELHKWLSTTTRLTNSAPSIVVPTTDPDWSWVAQHTSAKAY